MRMKRSDIAWLAALGGLLVVAYGVSQRVLAGKQAAHEAAAGQRQAGIARLREANARLWAEKETLAVERVAAAKRAAALPVKAPSGAKPDHARSAPLDLLADLRTRNLVTITPPRGGRERGGPSLFALNSEGQLPDRFAEVFGVGATQFAELQDVLIATKRQMDVGVALRSRAGRVRWIAL